MTGADSLYDNTHPQHLRCTEDRLATDRGASYKAPDYRFKWHHLAQRYALMMKTLLAHLCQRFLYSYSVVDIDQRRKINDLLSGLDTLL